MNAGSVGRNPTALGRLLLVVDHVELLRLSLTSICAAHRGGFTILGNRRIEFRCDLSRFFRGEFYFALVHATQRYRIRIRITGHRVILAINFRIIAELRCLIFVIDEFLAEFEILFVSFDMCDDAVQKRLKRMPLRD